MKVVLLTLFLFLVLSVSAIQGIFAQNTSDRNLDSFFTSTSGSLPFIQNVGQIDDQVKYYTTTFAGTSYITNDGIVYSIPNNSDQSISFKESFGTSLNPKGNFLTNSVINYFIGDKNEWRQNIPTFETVNVGEVYSGIFLSLENRNNNFEKIFRITPKGNVHDIKVEIEGIEKIELEENGELLIITELGNISMTKPVAYQEISGTYVDVPVHYKIHENGYGFDVGDYDKKHDLIIDPLLASTFIGGSNEELLYDIQVTDSFVYVAGFSASSNFPSTTGVYSNTLGGANDGIIAKYDKNLTTLHAATFLGGTNGNGGDTIIGMHVSGSDVYVVGETISSDFPTTVGAYDTMFGGGSNISDVFISKLSSDLTTLEASTYLGTSAADKGMDIVVVGSSVYVVGSTVSAAFPTTVGAYDTTFNGGNGNYGGDVFVSKFDLDLTSLTASTFLGGSSDESIWNLEVSGSSVYVNGWTTSSDFPTTVGAYDTTYAGGSQNDNEDVFISKLSSDLTTLEASTYLGGSRRDTSFDMKIVNSDLFVSGYTKSTDFPTTVGAYDETHNGSQDTFISKLNSGLTSLIASTFLGGTLDDDLRSMVVSNSQIFVTGFTHSTDFPVITNIYDETHNGNSDVFVSNLNSDLTSLIASTFLGGSTSDIGYAIFHDGESTYVVGQTESTNFPVTSGVHSTTQGGSSEGFISKLLLAQTIILPSGNPTHTITAASVISSIDARGIPIAELVISGGQSSTSNDISLLTDDATIVLPKSVTVTGGTTTLEFKESTKTPDPSVVRGNAGKILEFGDETGSVTFDKMVKISLIGKGGNRPFYIDSSDNTFLIDECAGTPTTSSSAASDLTITGGKDECYFKSGSDLIIWTFHFTGFGSFSSGSGGGGCDSDCTPPTLGVTSDGKRIVSNGFSYNDNPTNVELYYTPYPLITVDVGKANKAEFKIYENSGPDKIQHFDFAFGLADGQILSDSKARIEWEKRWDGTEIIHLVDPENVLDDVSVNWKIIPCGLSDDQCMLLTIHHMFRAPLEFDIVATNVWDHKRNAWQNYYNHGIHVQGESLNPPKEYNGIYKGHIIHLTETDKNKAVDEFGYSWTFDKIWTRDYIKPVQTPKKLLNDEKIWALRQVLEEKSIEDAKEVFGYDKNDSEFNASKTRQHEIAYEKMMHICPECLESYQEINQIFSYHIPVSYEHKLDNPYVIDKMNLESYKAQEYLQELYSKLYSGLHYD